MTRRSRRPLPCWPRQPSITASLPSGSRQIWPRLRRIRAEALAEAEQSKGAAAQEAEARIATAKKQAAAINERTQQEFAWRKQQLRRETELLHQRKQAVLSQLASLSALAEQNGERVPRSR